MLILNVNFNNNATTNYYVITTCSKHINYNRPHYDHWWFTCRTSNITHPLV